METRWTLNAEYDSCIHWQVALNMAYTCWTERPNTICPVECNPSPGQLLVLFPYCNLCFLYILLQLFHQLLTDSIHRICQKRPGFWLRTWEKICLKGQVAAATERDILWTSREGLSWNGSFPLSSPLNISAEPSVSRASGAPVSCCLPETCQAQPFHRWQTNVSPWAEATAHARAREDRDTLQEGLWSAD